MLLALAPVDELCEISVEISMLAVCIIFETFVEEEAPIVSCFILEWEYYLFFSMIH